MREDLVGQPKLGDAELSPGPRPTDDVLVSFPEPRSTWSSYLLDQLRSRSDEEFTDIKNEVVDITPGRRARSRNSSGTTTWNVSAPATTSATCGRVCWTGAAAGAACFGCTTRIRCGGGWPA